MDNNNTRLSTPPPPQNQVEHPFWPNPNLIYHSFNLNHHTENDSQPPPPNDTNNTNDDNDGQRQQPINDMKEAMFEKPLTPSDVGKLNRLVIPKQHAEKYFPLSGSGSGSGGDGADKGLLLSFEDESGKLWRFRYSYWNSSQSYVLTKGWSRYVKEKRLDAGDVVLFERHRHEFDRMFIGWRRRTAAAAAGPPHDGGGGGGGGMGGFYNAPHIGYPAHHNHNHINNSISQVVPAGVVPYQPDSIHAGLLSPAQHHQIQNQTTSLGNISYNNNNNSNSSSNNNNSKILRLFGVNLECHDNTNDQSEPSTPDGSSSSLSTHDHHHHHHQQQQQQFYPQAYYTDHHHYHHHSHMDFTFSRDVKPMRNRRG